MRHRGRSVVRNPLSFLLPPCHPLFAPHTSVARIRRTHEQSPWSPIFSGSGSAQVCIQHTRRDSSTICTPTLEYRPRAARAARKDHARKLKAAPLAAAPRKDAGAPSCDMKRDTGTRVYPTDADATKTSYNHITSKTLTVTMASVDRRRDKHDQDK